MARIREGIVSGERERESRSCRLASPLFPSRIKSRPDQAARAAR
jgi:hypothetical protein